MEWLEDAGIVNVCYCLDQLSLPLKGNYNPKMFKLYYSDTGLFVASLDEESQADIRVNKNYGTYKGAIYENVVGDMKSLIPVEVKANDNATPTLKKMTDVRYADIRYGIKLCNRNIGFNGQFYTLPYFLTFLLKRWLRKANSADGANQ